MGARRGLGRRQSFGGLCDKVQGGADQWQAGQEGSSVAKGNETQAGSGKDWRTGRAGVRG